jgi:hypothetical protein
MAQRILSVGSMDRALLVADLLDADKEVFQHLSGRGFLTITGGRAARTQLRPGARPVLQHECTMQQEQQQHAAAPQLKSWRTSVGAWDLALWHTT